MSSGIDARETAGHNRKITTRARGVLLNFRVSVNVPRPQSPSSMKYSIFNNPLYTIFFCLSFPSFPALSLSLLETKKKNVIKIKESWGPLSPRRFCVLALLTIVYIRGSLAIKDFCFEREDEILKGKTFLHCSLFSRILWLSPSPTIALHSLSLFCAIPEY